MKYALITGGSRGIGKAIALRLASAGWPIVINFLSNREAAQGVADEIQAQGGTCELLPFDTSDPQAIETALTGWEQLHPDDWFGVLVNNAGIRRDNVMFMMPDEDWHKVLDTTLNGYF
jgi:3-oxoacyl-[acyl-carrier protein] reductase